MIDKNQIQHILDTYYLVDDQEAKEYLGKAFVCLVNKLVQSQIYYMLPSEVAIATQIGKIAAIKLVRSRCQIGLKEAKDLVESEAIRLGFEFYTGQTPN